MSHDSFSGDYGTKLVPFDFNGDGRADLAFSRALFDSSNTFTGREYAVWTSNGLATPAQAVIGTVSSAWNSSVAFADFNGDGTTDLMFNRPTFDSSNNFTGYQYAIWTLNGTQVTGQGVIGNRGVDWYSYGELGDFDGNGSFDLFFARSTFDANNVYTGEQWAVWNTNGSNAPTQAVLGTSGPDWYVEELADFDGNGTTDLLFERETFDSNNTYTGQQYAVWTVNGTQVTGQAVLGTAGPDWDLDEVADFDGNGTADLLFERSTFDANNVYTGEQYAVWTVNGTQVTGQAVLGTAGPDWFQALTDDFDGNGTADLLFGQATFDSSNSFTGYQFAVWTVNGTQVTGQGVIGSTNSDWGYFQDDNDFNGDGATDLLFSKDNFDSNNVFTGTDYAVWLLDGAGAPVQKVIGTAGADWSYFGSGDVNGDGTADLTFVNYGTSQLAAWTLGSDGSVTAQAVIGTFDNPSDLAGWNPIS